MEEDCGVPDQSIGITGSGTGTKVRDLTLWLMTYFSSFLVFVYWVCINSDVSGHCWGEEGPCGS